ncbi:MAG TPA: DegT/DnrJ/EryC1/StrS family aminotransferase [bacterium]|nr:DegT/DnrJ/EryC1/StrS family aminotransferase [bacterium]
MIPISKPLIGKEEKAAVRKVLDSGIIASGPLVKEFERRFAAYQGVKNAVAAANGTCAIHTALYSLGIGQGDGVITTPFTFFATASSIVHAGAAPVFVDIEKEDFNISPEAVEDALKKDKKRKIKAVIVVHLYGQMCDMDAIMKIARRYGVKVIEDAAQAHGAVYKGKKAGQIGDAGTFSMYATKNMTSAEGGMVLFNKEGPAKTARVFINHGMTAAYHHAHMGYNYRTTDIEAAIGLEQLKKLDGFNKKRRENSAFLTGLLSGCGIIESPKEINGRTHIFHQYTIRVKNGERDGLLKHLNSEGIGAKVFYPVPLHKQPVFRKFPGSSAKLPESESAAKEVISLPVHPGLKKSEIQKIADAVKKYTGRR